MRPLTQSRQPLYLRPANGKRLAGVIILGALFAGGLLLAQLALPTTVQARATATPHVDVAIFDRQVDASGARYISDAIKTAEGDGASALVVQVDTPGGDINSMQSIVEAELAATVPIISYVGPEGAQAASAGSIIALAAPIVAMAPNTRIGAASPINIDGSDIGSTLKAKIEQDLTALLRSMQNDYHRNASAAESMVTNATAYTDSEAMSQNLITLQTGSLDTLLSQMEGYKAVYSNGQSFTLNLAGLPTQTLEPSVANTVETYLFDPNVLFILFIAAAICIYLELAHPGAIVPGVIGALALVVFLIGALGISPNWGGLALMLLAVVLLAIDVRAPTHGILTFGGLISLVAGALIFFDTGSNPGQQGVNLFIVIGFAVGVGLVALLVLRAVIAAQLRRVTTGVESYKGQIVTVIEPIAPKGRVSLQGENWEAQLASPNLAPPLPVGARARVTGSRDLTLFVEPAPEPLPAPPQE